MNHPSLLRSLLGMLAVCSFLGMPRTATGQDVTLVVEPESISIEVDGHADISASVVDSLGNKIDSSLLYFSQDARSVEVDSLGHVVAHKPGDFVVVVVLPGTDGPPQRVLVPVSVAYPPLARIEFNSPVRTVYVGTTVEYSATTYDEADLVRDGVELKVASDRPEIATIDGFWKLTALRPGRVTLTSWTGDVQSKHLVDILPNPVVRLAMSAGPLEARTGDVLAFATTAYDSDEVEVNVPIQYLLTSQPDDELGQAASAILESDGRFVAETPGVYTIAAKSGSQVVQQSVRIVQRDVSRPIEVLGQGKISDVHTSDLWVWEAVDGRDYAITGTWGGNGETIFWDVTDPSKIERVASLTVDARTVNDVKVSEDGTVCVISREGASNRKNGIVIIDCTDPTNPTIVAEYNDELTGGVHNVFLYDRHVYAVNNGRRYDIINIEDPAKPYRVGRFELGTPGHAIHDVWIEDGIAYSSNWRDGIQMVDIGSATERGALKSSDASDLPQLRDALEGGSPENPVQVASYSYPSGRNHAAFPFHSESTGKFYVAAGDESFPYGLDLSAPGRAAGYVHFIDFTNPAEPDEVARYEVPEAGSHNYWIEGDIMYAAFYNGGLRVVDLSGDLLGDLYRQGREIAQFRPFDAEGIVPNAPFTWGPMPHKGVVFFTDWNSGLWAVKLGSKE